MAKANSDTWFEFTLLDPLPRFFYVIAIKAKNLFLSKHSVEQTIDKLSI